MLIDFLRRSDTNELDYIYQSDVTWFDKNHQVNNHNMMPQRILEYNETSSQDHSIETDSKDNFSVGESFTANKRIDEAPKIRSRFLSDDDKKDLDQALKELIDASEIVGEKIYNLGKNHTWIEKSFDIKLNKDLQNNNQGGFHLSRLADKKAENTGGLDNVQSIIKNAAPKTTGNKISEAYNNNTVLYQFNMAALGKVMNETDNFYQPILNYKSVTNIIDKHLKQEIHIFRKMLNLFEGYFANKYTVIIENYKQERITSETFDEAAIIATYDLQYFITIFYEGLNLYYQLKSLRIGKLPDGDTLFDRENVISFLNSIIFNEKIYNLLFELYSLQDALVEENYQKSLMRFKNSKPEDFSVPAPFCLNEKTLDYIKENHMVTPKDVPFIVSDFSASPILNEVDSLRGNDKELTVEVKKGKFIEEIKTGSGLATPYEKVIQTLSTLPSRRSPVHKLKTILKAMELIGISISEFYEDAGAQNSKKLDADNTLSVCLYIVARAGLENLNAHCKIIQRFSTAGALNSISGYYASTLEACVTGLCEMDKKHLEMKNEVKKELRKQSFSPFDVESK